MQTSDLIRKLRLMQFERMTDRDRAVLVEACERLESLAAVKRKVDGRQNSLMQGVGMRGDGRRCAKLGRA